VRGSGIIAVTGATGRQGGAVARHLLADGWRVRALTRDPASSRAALLARKGAELTACTMMDVGSLVRALDGAQGVYSVQNPMIDGLEAETTQGKNVADAAATVGVPHVVYGSAGTGQPGTGIGSWESKAAVAAHLRRLGVPLTVLRPTAFMELMTDRAFYPAVSTWGLMPKLMGEDRPVSWLSVDDLGAIAARAFAAPEEFVGKDLALAADLRSIAECRDIWRRVTGHAPRAFPLPVWAFHRAVGSDLTTMWRWLRDHDVPVDPETTRGLLPGMSTVEQFVRRHSARGRSGARALRPGGEEGP
jgi:uncharacterized protein YbjT (DUF2867 family)